MTFAEKVKGVFLKIGKRNLIIIGAVVAIGVAICLNLILFADDDGGYTYSGGNGMQSELNDQKNPTSGTNDSTSVSDEYFSSGQVQRQRARDEALLVLNAVIDNQNATDDVKAEAVAEIKEISLQMSQEANIESIIVSKGFQRCVAVINGDSANIVVSCEGNLTANQLAQINAVVFEQAGIEPLNITIVGKTI